MDERAPGAEELRRAVRRAYVAVLATLAVCALLIVTQADPADDGGLGQADRRFTVAALALGIGSIVARGRAADPRTEPRLRLILGLLSLVLAAAIGVLGVALAVLQDEREAALLYTLGAALLALRGGMRAPARGRG